MTPPSISISAMVADKKGCHTKIHHNNVQIQADTASTKTSITHLRTGLGETENVVNEKEHILSLLITEILGNGQSSKGDTGTSAWGLVHLTVHKGYLKKKAKFL